MSDQQAEDEFVTELKKQNAELAAALVEPDAAARLTELLPQKLSPGNASGDAENPTWDRCGLYLMNRGRINDALAVLWLQYQSMLQVQDSTGRRMHKGTALVRISDCFRSLNYPAHTKRYLMLTLCEDALSSNGVISPTTMGVYFRLVWGHGLSDKEIRRYAKLFYDLSLTYPKDAFFPEALSQRIDDDDWITEFPSANEVLSYRLSTHYAQHLLAKLGDITGEALELLAQYLMSCMPGCRTLRRKRSGSTDYDIICTMEGPNLDFRSELGRYFVCECKDWDKPADFTVMAKFCRVLDSTKSKFGILFSKNGISGTGKTKFAEREQLKIFQDRGVVIVVLDLSDLQDVASGNNLIAMLRRRYEAVRLDLSS